MKLKRWSATGYERRCRFEQMEPRRVLSANGLSQTFEPVGSVSATTSDLGTIQGSVFVSADNECHTNRTGLSEVLVELLNETGEVVQQAQTDSQGNYEFNGLLPGVYAVQQYVPEGYSAFAAHVGNGGGIAFNDNLVGEIFVVAGSQLDGYNFCGQSHENIPEQNDAREQEIVQHTGQPGLDNTFVPLPNFLTGQTASFQADPLIVQQNLVFTSAVYQPLFESVSTPRSEPIFGGSSKKLDDETSDFDAVFSEIFALLASEEHSQEEHFSACSSCVEDWPGGNGEIDVEHDVVDQAFEVDEPIINNPNSVSAPAPSTPYVAQRPSQST